MKVPDYFPRGILNVVGVLCLLFVVSANVAVAQTSFNYPPFPTTGASGGLTTNGNATSSSAQVQLTSSNGDQVGSAWYVNNAAGNNNGTVSLVNGFNTTFTFQLTGQNANQGSINSCGGVARGGADGISFVVQNGQFAADGTSGSTAVGPHNGAGGQIGLTGLTNSVGVIFDTWYNGEYHDTCAAAASPTSADQVTIESCASGAANTVDHNGGCQFATVDLSRIANPIFMGDGQSHTTQISYAAPAVTGNCPIGSALGANGCGSLTVTIDNQVVLTAPFNLNNLSLDASADAYVGFTGATGGAWETQLINSWMFAAGAATTVTNPVPPGGTVNNQFSTTTGNVNGYSYDFSTTNGQVLCNNLPCGPTNLVSNNIQVTGNTWPQYVIGTPYATSVLPARPGNGTGAPGSIFANACYNNNVPISSASDALCPAATGNEGNTISNFITVKDTFDQPADSKLPLLPGTTVALIDFHPADSTIDWNPDTDTVSTAVNPACTNLNGNNNGGVVTPTLCYLLNALDSVYGDQTTTRGSKPPKNATKLATVFGVPMPLTTVNISAAGCPSIATDIPLNNSNEDLPGFGTPASTNQWFNGACQFYFAVNPAKVPQAYNCPQGVPVNNNACNNFTPAPPAVLSYGLGTAPSNQTPDTFLYNPNLSDNMHTWTTSSTPLTGSGGLFPGDGAAQPFHWASLDTLGITEKNIYLKTTGVASDCDNPDTDPNLKPPCYNTRYLNSIVNIDSVAPVVTCNAAPATNVWYPANQSIACSATDALSGIGTASPNAVTGVPSAGGATVYFNVGTSVAANTSQGAAAVPTESLCDLAQNCSSTPQLGPYGIDQVAPSTVSISFVSNNVVYGNNAQIPYGHPVNVVYSCTDDASGLASCATQSPLACAAPPTGGVLNYSTAQAPVNSAPGTYTLANVNSTDCAGNASSPVTPKYTVVAPTAADVALFEGFSIDAVKHGNTYNYPAWALDLTKGVSAQGVTVTSTVTIPTSSLGGTITGKAALVTCNLLTGCSAIVEANACTITNSTVSGANTIVTLACSIGTLPSIYKLEGARMQLAIPVSSKATIGSTFKIDAIVTSANDPNSGNNHVSDIIVVK